MNTTFLNFFFRGWQAYGELHPRLFRSVSREGHLYHCQIRAKGNRFKLETIEDFEQEDLNDDDIMIMDAGDEVYVWIGKGATEREIEKGPVFAEVKLKLYDIM